MVVDHCSVAEVTEDILTSVEDNKACQASGTLTAYHFVLQVSTPLELGGRSKPDVNYPAGLSTNGFDGGMRNLRHNGVVGIIKENFQTVIILLYLLLLY